MSVKYYQEDDLLVIKYSNKPFKAAEKIGNFLVHYDKSKKPVLVEILNASKLLKETTKALPKALREEIMTSNP